MFDSLSVQSNRSSILRRTATTPRTSTWRKARRRRKKRTWAHPQRRDRRRRPEVALTESPGWRWGGSSGSHTGESDRGVREVGGAFASSCVCVIQVLRNQPSIWPLNHVMVLCEPDWCLVVSTSSSSLPTQSKIPMGSCSAIRRYWPRTSGWGACLELSRSTAWTETPWPPPPPSLSSCWLHQRRSKLLSWFKHLSPLVAPLQ